MSGKRRQEAVDRKTLILDAAEQIMREEGYAAVTSRRVAERTGSKTMPIHYHFGSMDDLFLALYRRSEEKYFGRLASAISSETPLHDLWELGRNPADTGLVGEYLALANHRPSVRSEVARSGERVRAIEAALVSASLRDVELKPQNASPAVLAFILESICRTLVSEQALGISSTHKEVEDFVARVLAQVEPAGGHQYRAAAVGTALAPDSE